MFFITEKFEVRGKKYERLGIYLYAYIQFNPYKYQNTMNSASSTGISGSPESKPGCTYPTIKELQAKFQEKNPDMYFDMGRDPGDPVELVFCGKLPCDKGGDAWSEFLKEHADKFLKEAGMYS